jgi:hypothetical protein
MPNNDVLGDKKGDFIITHGKSKATLHCRAHLAHYASVSQEGISVKIFQRPSPVSAMALGGQETLWPGDIKLHGYFESRAPACG